MTNPVLEGSSSRLKSAEADVQKQPVSSLRVTVWGEPVRFSDNPRLRKLQEGYHASTLANYPDGLHEVIATALRSKLGAAANVQVATLDDPDQGLSQSILDETDVLVWWSHTRNDELRAEAAKRVCERIQGGGMGFVPLHSALESKPFLTLMGTSCRMERWRQGPDYEAVWTVAPAHEISAGVPAVFVIPEEEMYCEYFDIPTPDELVFISSFAGGEVFRSGCCFYRGKGRIFYFRPGHEAHPTFHQVEVQQILANAVRWAYTPSPSTGIFRHGWEEKEGEPAWFLGQLSGGGDGAE